MPFGCSKRRALAGALAASLLLAACKDDGKASSTASPSSTTGSAHGVVRIGVWQPADPALNTYGGAATRTLIYPQLFRAQPDGSWAASIVVAGSDKTASDARSARFRIRRDAVWSNGARIGVLDLRRTIDPRFVARVDAPNERGEVVVHFTQRLPGWRRLWSGLDSISPPAAGIYGGPYRLDHVTSGLETVLVANRTSFETPAIREVRFVTVPQAEVAARLMERGELDVIAPPAFTDRTVRLERIKDARVVRGGVGRGGLMVSLVANPTRLSREQRLRLFGLVDRKRFVDVVLHDEASYDGPTQPAATATPPTSAVPALSAPVESSPVSLFAHAMQRRGRIGGVTFDLRQAEFDQVLGAYGMSDFDVVLNMQPSTPDRCWICEAANVNAQLASDAEAHRRGAAERLQRLLAAEGFVLPLWREVPVIAVRDGLAGVEPNGFSAAGPAWNLAQWRWAD